MTKFPIAVAALVLLGACTNKDTSNANGGAMADSSAGAVNATTTPPPSSTSPSTTTPPTTTPSAATTPPMADSSAMGRMGKDSGKMAGRRGHHMKKDSTMTH